jgi:hypothetical protein
VAQFGAVAIQPGAVQGIWVHEGVRYEDDLRRFVVDVDDTAENQAFFTALKPILMQRFEQLVIYIVSFPVDFV